MTRRLRYIIRFSALFAFLALLCSCSSVVNLNADLKEYNVNLYLKEYTPTFSVPNPEYKGKKMCLDNIRNDARNTTNFSYYSKDNRVQYLLSNRANTHVQLVPSFFWYAYQKAFEYAGIETLARCEANIPEVWIVFLSFNEDELKFKLTLYENKEKIFEKDMTVSMPPATERNPLLLQKRGYDMIDLTVQTILNDSGFQAAFF
ncbi:MAG TPA: hypothetical protein VKO67_00530 [Smithellaceae bacterium]|nr:hypothetical protein [Smithellaceae bacterium]